MTPAEIQQFANKVNRDKACSGKRVRIKRPDGFYLTRSGGWSQNQAEACVYDYNRDGVSAQLEQVQNEFGLVWAAEIVEEPEEMISLGTFRQPTAPGAPTKYAHRVRIGATIYQRTASGETVQWHQQAGSQWLDCGGAKLEPQFRMMREALRESLKHCP